MDLADLVDVEPDDPSEMVDPKRQLPPKRASERRRPASSTERTGSSKHSALPPTEHAVEHPVTRTVSRVGEDRQVLACTM